MKAAGDPALRTRDLVVMMGGSQPLHPGSTPGVCTSIDDFPPWGCKSRKVHHSTREVLEWLHRAAAERDPRHGSVSTRIP